MLDFKLKFKNDDSAPGILSVLKNQEKTLKINAEEERNSWIMANANANDPVKVGPDSGVQCNLDLVTLNLVTILQRPFFNVLHKIKCNFIWTYICSNFL